MKIDFHCHSYYSNDGLSSPEKLIRSALKKGLDGIALTDHNTTRGWEKAIRAANKLGAVLIPGEEIKINGQGEILAYFLKKEINPKGKNIEEIIKEIKKQKGIAIIAHPYHWRKPFKDLKRYKNLVDGIEAFNARSHNKKGNQKSIEFAKKNNLAITAGSDAHCCSEVGNAFLEANAQNIENLKKAILERDVKIWGKQSSIFYKICPTLARIIHLFWKL